MKIRDQTPTLAAEKFLISLEVLVVRSIGNCTESVINKLFKNYQLDVDSTRQADLGPTRAPISTRKVSVYGLERVLFEHRASIGTALRSSSLADRRATR